MFTYTWLIKNFIIQLSYLYEDMYFKKIHSIFEPFPDNYSEVIIFKKYTTFYNQICNKHYNLKFNSFIKIWDTFILLYYKKYSHLGQRLTWIPANFLVPVAEIHPITQFNNEHFLNQFRKFFLNCIVILKYRWN